MAHPLDPTYDRAQLSVGLCRRARRIALAPLSHAEDADLGSAVEAVPDDDLRAILLCMTLVAASLMLQLEPEAADAWLDTYTRNCADPKRHRHEEH